jgi:hypothetical protein
VTTYHLAEVAGDGHMTVYCTTHTSEAAERMLAALHAAGHPDVQIVPVGRDKTFAERYAAVAA